MPRLTFEEFPHVVVSRGIVERIRNRLALLPPKYKTESQFRLKNEMYTQHWRVLFERVQKLSPRIRWTE